jgi:hypothetical protein
MNEPNRQKHKTMKPHTLRCLALSLALVPAALLATAHMKKFAGERIEFITGNVMPVWLETAGAYVEVSGAFATHAAAEASAVVRMFDEGRPLALAWDSAGGWQMLQQGGLPQDLEGERSREPQTMKWRLQVRGLQKSLQRLRLEVWDNGAWQRIAEQDMSVSGVRDWVDDGGVLTVGLVGAELLDANVRVIRENTLLMVK